MSEQPTATPKPWKSWQIPCTKCGKNPIAPAAKVAEWMGTVLPKLHATVLAPMAGEAPHGAPWRVQAASFEGTLAATLETWRWNLMGLCEACAPEDVRERMADEGVLNTEAYSRWLGSVPPSHDAHPDSVRLAELRASLAPFLEVAKGTAHYMRGTDSAPKDDLEVWKPMDCHPEEYPVVRVGDCRRLVDILSRYDRDMPQPMVQVVREREELRALLFALVELDRVPVDLISRAVRILGGTNLPREAAAGRLERLLAALEPVLKFALDTEGGPQPDSTVLASGKSGVPLRRNDLLAVADACLPGQGTRPWVVQVAAGLADERAQKLRGTLQRLYANLSAVLAQFTGPLGEEAVVARAMASGKTVEIAKAEIVHERMVAAHQMLLEAMQEAHGSLLEDWPAAERVVELLSEDRQREEAAHSLMRVRVRPVRPEDEAEFRAQLAGLDQAAVITEASAVHLVHAEPVMKPYAKLVAAAAPLAAYFAVEMLGWPGGANEEEWLTPRENLTLEHVNSGGAVTVGQVRSFIQAMPLLKTEGGTWVYGPGSCEGRQGVGEGHEFGDATTQLVLAELTHPLSAGLQVAEELGVEVVRECRFCTRAWAEVKPDEDERGGLSEGAAGDGAS